MLNNKLALFHELVWKAADKVGYSAPAITDKIIGEVFPRTVKEAEYEGADKMLREGVKKHIANILKDSPHDDQIDFGAIALEFRTITKKIGLKRARYYVESVAAYVEVPRLIAEPEFLNDARSHLRRKGEECIAEADRLDELYLAVIAGKV
jgi:hypothetical protein